jgi:hypothetical protein
MTSPRSVAKRPLRLDHLRPLRSEPICPRYQGRKKTIRSAICRFPP